MASMPGTFVPPVRRLAVDRLPTRCRTTGSWRAGMGDHRSSRGREDRGERRRGQPSRRFPPDHFGGFEDSVHGWLFSDGCCGIGQEGSVLAGRSRGGAAGGKSGRNGAADTTSQRNHVAAEICASLGGVPPTRMTMSFIGCSSVDACKSLSGCGEAVRATPVPTTMRA
jgi:hypothetical protein